MKRTLRVVLFLFIGSLFIMGEVAAQNRAVTCQLGFAFEISRSKNWGYKEPVIVDVTPGSPAERAGLKLNDIILSVNKNGKFPITTFLTVVSKVANNLFSAKTSDLESAFISVDFPTLV